MAKKPSSTYVEPGTHVFSAQELKLLGNALDTELARLKRAAGNSSFPESAREGFGQEFAQVNDLARKLGGQIAK